MVISLCWKVGSSKTGLKGMKEVAKGYKEKEKVGFANLSQGIDVYVCPRSDTIITILAKYGFFKGMAAVEDDQDSLIGCVVWRRNRTSSNSVSKKTEKKVLPLSEQPMNSSSDTTISQNAETTTLLTAQESEGINNTQCITQTDGSSSLHNSEARFTVFETTRSLATDSKNIQSRKDPINGSNLFVNSMPMLTPLVPNSPPVISMGLPIAHKPDSSSPLDLIGREAKVEVPIVEVSEPETPHTLAASVLPGQSQVLMGGQQRSAGSDDDDLPEFDFSTACGLPQRSVTNSLLSSSMANFSNAPFGNKFPVEGIKNASGPAPPSLHILTPITVLNQQRPESSTFPALTLSSSQGMAPPNKLGDHQTQVSVLPSSDNKQATTSREHLNKPSTVKPVNSSSGAIDSNFSQKNLWDDDNDDDMPEWCPPDLDHRKQPPAADTFRPHIPSPMPTRLASEMVSSHPFIPSQSPAPDLDHRKQPSAAETFRPPIPSPMPTRLASEMVPSHPFIPSQSPAYVQPPLPPQFFPHGFSQHPPSNTAMPVQTRPVGGYVQFNSSSSPGFNPNTTLRPQSPMFDVRHHIRPSDWKLDWRS